MQATPTPPGGAAKPDVKAKKDKKPRKARPHKPNVLPKWQGLQFKLPTKKGPKTIEQYSRPIPPPRCKLIKWIALFEEIDCANFFSDGMTLPLFLKLIGKNAVEVVGDKIKTWEELFTLRRRELKTLGIPVKQRRHILKWVELYRMGEEPRSFRMKSIAKKRKNEKKAARDKHLALLKQVNIQREKDGLPKCYIPQIKEPIKVKKAPPQKKKADKAPKKD